LQIPLSCERVGMRRPDLGFGRFHKPKTPTRARGTLDQRAWFQFFESLRSNPEASAYSSVAANSTTPRSSDMRLALSRHSPAGTFTR